MSGLHFAAVVELDSNSIIMLSGERRAPSNNIFHRRVHSRAARHTAQTAYIIALQKRLIRARTPTFSSWNFRPVSALGQNSESGTMPIK